MNREKGFPLMRAIFILLVASALVAAGIILIKNSFNTGREIKLSADAYSLLRPCGGGERNVVRIDSKEQVEKINKVLSGKYREGRRLAEIDENSSDFVCIAIPIYKTDDYKKIDEYSESAYHEETDDGHIIYGEGIYILNNKTIAFWDGRDEKENWTGKKKDNKIDVDLFDSLMETKQ